MRERVATPERAMRKDRALAALLIACAACAATPCAARAQSTGSEASAAHAQLSDGRARALLDTIASRIVALELRRLELQSDSGLVARHYKVLNAERALRALWTHLGELPDTDSARTFARGAVLRALEARLAHAKVEEIELVSGGMLKAEHPRVHALQTRARLLLQRHAEILREPTAGRNAQASPEE